MQTTVSGQEAAGKNETSAPVLRGLKEWKRWQRGRGLRVGHVCGGWNEIDFSVGGERHIHA